METPTRHPLIYEEVGRLETSRGEVTVMLTQNPIEMQPFWFYTYVALAHWMPASTPVVMFVTASFSGCSKREVNLVYATPVVRYDERIEGTRDSVPVQIGTWLFERSLLTHHSVDRTASGDRWARRVGGFLPELAAKDDPQRGTPEATERSSLRAYAALCETEWKGWSRSLL